MIIPITSHHPNMNASSAFLFNPTMRNSLIRDLARSHPVHFLFLGRHCSSPTWSQNVLGKCQNCQAPGRKARWIRILNFSGSSGAWNEQWFEATASRIVHFWRERNRRVRQEGNHHLRACSTTESIPENPGLYPFHILYMYSFRPNEWITIIRHFCI